MDDLDTLVRKNNAPIELRTENSSYFCGRTKFTVEERRGEDKHKLLENGWCATKLDDDKKIERYGFCNSACKDVRQGFMFANLNLLTNEECATLIRHDETKPIDEKVNMEWNKEYEICTGKKNKFPKHLTMVRTRRTKKERKELKAKAKKLGLARGYKPGKYSYKMEERTKISYLKTPENYEYDWFLGGRDSCQGDSGGPLWRNIKDSNGKMRATQIATVSRGAGCAFFNAPGLFPSVKKSFNWIKEVVEKEMKKEDYCPKK